MPLNSRPLRQRSRRAPPRAGSRARAEAHHEYSLYHTGRHLWASVGEDGGIRFDSAAPVSLRQFYPDPAAGSESFAQSLLDTLVEQAGTGEVVDGRWVSCDPGAAALACVSAFAIEPPSTLASSASPAALAFNHNFRSDNVIFEVSGPQRMVDDYLRDYLFEFPAAYYRTRFSVQRDDGSTKTVRVLRHRTFD